MFRNPLRRRRSADDLTGNPFQDTEDLLNRMDPTEGPTAYELVEPDALRRAHDPRTPARLQPIHHWEEAVVALEHYNDPTTPLNARAKAALGRLKALGNLDRWHGDLFMKIFLDIDDLFFNRNLRENVCVRWACEPDMGALAYCCPVGAKGIARTSIHFNVPHLVADKVTVHEAIMIVIHEMIHAYVKTHCDSDRRRDTATVDRIKFERKERQGIGGQGDHGLMAHGVAFTRCLRGIQRRLGPTRYLFMGHLGGQPGGTVAIGTDLRKYWDYVGGYCTNDKFEHIWNEVQEFGPPPPMPTRDPDDERMVDEFLASNPWDPNHPARPRGRGGYGGPGRMHIPPFRGR